MNKVYVEKIRREKTDRESTESPTLILILLFVFNLTRNLGFIFIPSISAEHIKS